MCTPSSDITILNEKRPNIRHAIDHLKRRIRRLRPVNTDGRIIAKKFWGKAWLEHIDNYYYDPTILMQGRLDVRNETIFHLDIQKGKTEAIVWDNGIHDVEITTQLLCNESWRAIKDECLGQIPSALELLEGKLNSDVVNVLTHHEYGLFPSREALEKVRCSCESTNFCTHIAAVLYGIANRLDKAPELIFLMRGVLPQELLEEIILPTIEIPTSKYALDDALVESIFGISMNEK